MPLMDRLHRELLFTEARTHRAWTERVVDDATLRELYALLRMPSTSSNSQPMRIVFVRSAEAKERLKLALSAGNVAQTMAAPVTAIIATDTQFYENMPLLAPESPNLAEKLHQLPTEVRERMAFQSSTLQGGYLILAARALGLDCGPMGGFDREILDRTFFPDGRWRSNFLVNLGYGDASKLKPRQARLSFEDACRIE